MLTILLTKPQSDKIKLLSYTYQSRFYVKDYPGEALNSEYKERIPCKALI
jgi:hypothetical protein